MAYPTSACRRDLLPERQLSPSFISPGARYSEGNAKRLRDNRDRLGKKR